MPSTILQVDEWMVLCIPKFEKTHACHVCLATFYKDISCCMFSKSDWTQNQNKLWLDFKFLEKNEPQPWTFLCTHCHVHIMNCLTLCFSAISIAPLQLGWPLFIVCLFGGPQVVWFFLLMIKFYPFSKCGWWG